MFSEMSNLTRMAQGPWIMTNKETIALKLEEMALLELDSKEPTPISSNARCKCTFFHTSSLLNNFFLLGYEMDTFVQGCSPISEKTFSVRCFFEIKRSFDHRMENTRVIVCIQFWHIRTLCAQQLFNPHTPAPHMCAFRIFCRTHTRTLPWEHKNRSFCIIPI